MLETSTNPFIVQTPEDIPAEYTVAVFVNVFTDFYKIPHKGHTFVHGPRGSGKSMMFRFLQPDCQCLAKKKDLRELDFYGAYVPIKNTDLKLTELIRLENQNANIILNEHFMVLYIAVKLFGGLAKLFQIVDPAQKDQLGSTKAFLENRFIRLLQQAGWECDKTWLSSSETMSECWKAAEDICDELYKSVVRYLRKLSFARQQPTYEGPLCGYLDFLHPLLRDLRRLPFMPPGPIYLLMDDADNLNLTQTMILNSWVSSRTSADVSIKISTQLNYKTYRTVTGTTIDTPHDYSEVDIATVYTSSRDKYRDRVREIVRVRLNRILDVETKPEEFFPVDEEQERQIDHIASQIRARFGEEGRGFRPSDDVVRYARPDYIKSLRGRSKSGFTYNYAGFDQLVHLSDGCIRYFLEPASLMYAEEESLHPANRVNSIRPSIQHKIAYQQAESLMFSEFDKIRIDPGKDPAHLKKVQKLGNLIQALGGTFRAILLSDRSERKVFSIAFSDTPDDEIISVLRLGIEYGYFRESAIGNKEGTGRTKLYILTRRLAPHFTLDVTGFAGYLFVTSNSIRAAMHDPAKLLRNLEGKNIDEVFSRKQLELFTEIPT
jgi:hypothetical protein